jgi:carboxymethylenebutenolidase
MRFEFGRRAILHGFCNAAVSAAAATLVWPSSLEAIEIAPDDPSIHTERVRVASGDVELTCYQARPAAGSIKTGGVLLAHDSLGLTPHFENLARRLAVEGFAVLAPDFGSRYGGTPADPDPARETIGMETWQEWSADIDAAAAWLRQQPFCNGKVAALGFGLGGSAIGRSAVLGLDVEAVVLFYARVPPLSSMKTIKAPLLLHYASDDALVNPDVPAFLQALEASNATVESYFYDRTKRAFDDDSSPDRYQPGAAMLAWTRTVTFLHQALG